MRVVCTYEDGKVVCVGDDIFVALTISSSELLKMYRGKQGVGEINIAQKVTK